MLVNEYLKNREVATQFGVIKFNEKGECKDLTPAQEKTFANLEGYKVVEEKKKAESKPKEDKKEEPKKPAKKSTAKKSTAKKKESK